MISLLNPRFLLFFVIWTAGLAVFSYQSGVRSERQASELREKRISEHALLAKQDADAKTRDIERKMTDALADRDRQYQQEKSHAQAENDRLLADVRALRRRLSVPIIRPVCRAGADPDPSAAAGTGDDGRAELDPRAGEFLISIAERGDNAIRKHAEVVERYEIMRAACMRQPQP